MAVQPLVSVIVATNRRGEFLDEALRSVARQSYPNRHVLIVDDGSPVPGEIDRIAGRYDQVRVIHQSSAGVSVARNVGVAESTGEYCAFLDDDDVWLPGRLALQVAALRQDDRAVLAYGRVSSIDSAGHVLAPPTQSGAADVHAVFDGSGTPQFQTVLIRRRDLIRVGGFHSGLRYAEDLDLLLRLAREGPFVFVDEELAHYRQHGANATRAYRALAASIDAVVRLHAVRAAAEHDRTSEDLRTRLRANRRYAFWRAARAIRAGGLRRGAAEIGWALRFAPLAPVDALARRVTRDGSGRRPRPFRRG